MHGETDVVLFDLDDTLCTYRQSAADVLSTAFSSAGVEPCFTAADYYDRYEEYLEDSDGIRDLRERCFGDLAVAAGHDRETGAAVARAYAAERDQTALETLAGVRDALDALVREYRLGLVTNGAPEMQREKLAAIGLEDDFEVIVFGGYDTLAKPSSEPFERALAALEATPERAVHVGNSLTTDVAGARAAGVRAAWVPFEDEQTTLDPDLDPEPDYVLESLADLTSPPWE